MPKVKHVKANKDYPENGIQRGEMYYRWSVKTGPRSSRTYKQKTPPLRSQLTSSEFLQTYYDLDDRISAMGEPDELEDLIQEITTLKEETEERLENMPEGLKEGPTGITLQERIDGLDSWISDLESLEVPERDNYDSDDDYEEAKQEFVQQASGCSPGL